MKNNFLLNKEIPPIIRMPVKSLNDCYPIFNGEKIDYDFVLKLLNDKYIKNALYIASPELYSALIERQENNEEVIISFLKYYIRMCTRSTPFGLFSSVSLIKNADLSNENNRLLSPKIRVAMEWIYDLNRKIIQEMSIFPHLSVVQNDAIHGFKTRTNFFGDSVYGKEHKKGSSLKKTILLDYILELTKDKFILIAEVFQKIQKNCDNSINPKDIYSYVYELVLKGVLVTNLEPCFNKQQSRIAHTISILSSIPAAYSYYSRLSNIELGLQRINMDDIDFPQEKLMLIKEKMEKLVKSDRYFDSILVEDFNTISINSDKYNIGSELLDFLSSISLKLPINSTVSNYTERFLDKFGLSRELNLLHLLNSVHGLGFPTEYSNRNQNTPSNLFLNEMQTIFNNLLVKSIINNTYEIHINHSDIINLIERTANVNNDIDLSSELFFTELTDNKQILPNSVLYLAPSYGSKQVGNTIGRFIDGFNKENQELIKENNELIVKSYEMNGIDLVTLISSTSKSTLLNLIPNLVYTKYVCFIGINCTMDNLKKINLNEISVGVDKEKKLYFRNKLTNRRIKFVSFSNANSQIFNSLYRFLMEFTNSITPINAFHYMNQLISWSEIRPRLKYKNIVVSPLTIKCDKKSFIKKDEIDEIRLKNFIQHYIKENFVYLKLLDNKLLLDINNNQHFSIIVKNLRRQSTIIITEVEEFMKDSFATKYLTEKRVCEVVVPYINQSPKYYSTILPNPFLYERRNIKEEFLPCTEWYSIYIHIHAKQIDFFLLKYVKPFLDTLSRDKMIKKFFYIRYFERSDHIRLRIMPSVPNDLQTRLISFFQEIKETDLVKEIEIKEYVREIERYGGDNCIEDAETAFMYNSLLAFKLLEMKNKNYKIESIMPLFIIEILYLFGLKDKDINTIFDSKIYRGFRKEYREIKDELKKNYFRLNNKDKNIFGSLLDIQKDSVIYYRKLLENEGLTSETINNIAISYIHMFCNRVYGIDRVLEIKSYSFVHHFMRNKRYFDEEKNK